MFLKHNQCKMALGFNSSSIFVIILIFCSVGLTTGISLADDLRITYGQKVTLDKFREIVIPKLPHDYMKENIYLIPWLRVNNFDLKQSVDMLMQNIKWRDENKMDTIQSEDWSDMKADFPYHMDGFDKQGQPVFTTNIGEWDFRRAFISGKMPRLVRYLDKIMDEVTSKIRELQKEGKNVTRWILIENLDGFNLAQHFCPQCAPRFTDFLTSLDNHFPGSTDKIILINASPAVEFVFPIIRNTIRPETYASMHIFDRNKPVWQKYLLALIDKSQLRHEFGGTKKS